MAGVAGDRAAGGILTIFALLAVAIHYGVYRLARRWSTRTEMSLAALAPFVLMAVLFALVSPHFALLTVWSALLGSLVWLANLGIERLRGASLDLPAWITGGLILVHWPALIVMSYYSSGPSDVAILAALGTPVVFLVLPAVESGLESLRREGRVERATAALAE